MEKYIAFKRSTVEISVLKIFTRKMRPKLIHKIHSRASAWTTRSRRSAHSLALWSGRDAVTRATLPATTDSARRRRATRRSGFPEIPYPKDLWRGPAKPEVSFLNGFSRLHRKSRRPGAKLVLAPLLRSRVARI
jgi:hypothetical protein